MWIVKAWINEGWKHLGMFASLEDANFHQDMVWLNAPHIITEVEDRSLFS